MSTVTIIDSHAHIQFSAYDADRDAVVSRARDAGGGMVNVGTQFSTSEAAVNLARKHPGSMWATVGFHPGHIGQNSHHDSMELRELHREGFEHEKFLEMAQNPEVVAIGECGLDYYRMNSEQGTVNSTKNIQKEVFLKQIEIAKEVKKPLVIHCRRAFTDLVILLTAHCPLLTAPAGVVHFFSGSWNDAKRLMELGFFLGFGGVVTFAREYDDVVRKTPLDRILLETDAPYVAPAPYRGKRNEPAYIVEVVKKIAELKEVGRDEVAAMTIANAKQLFGI